MDRKMSARTVRARPVSRRLSGPVVAALIAAKIIGIRSGTNHRFTGVWVVVVRRRAFIRSWNDKPTGWRQAFAAEPCGTLQVADRQIRILMKPVRGESLLTAIDRAYREKYPSEANRKWVRGFKVPRRRNTTMEIVAR